ncbi:hypothetical protein UY3_12108 [Chelonia mydas]|uniref:Uncharacterized protein n=1 Tax=Chelonia mydas TaxID=8469 RepID=M7AYP7_CHEMY|nr:hypothetical protein UY3_12108 [Chelonia mydas]
MLAPLPAAPIGLERRTAASGSRDWLNLRTQQDLRHEYGDENVFVERSNML